MTLWTTHGRHRALPCLFAALALWCAAVASQGAPDTAPEELAAAIGRLNDYRATSTCRAEKADLWLPVELDVAALAGPGAPRDGDLTKEEVRASAYRAVVRDLLLMSDADMGAAQTRLRQVRDACRVAGKVLSFPASLGELAGWLQLPAVQAFYDRYPLLNQVPGVIGVLVKGLGPYATGLRLTSDAFDVLQLLAINEAAVARRGELLAQAVAALAAPDPALLTALPLGREDAVATARSFTAATGRVLAQRYLAAGKVADAASLLKAATRAGQAIAPTGLVRALGRLTGPLATAARHLTPYLATFRVQWDDVASARHNLQRAVMAATLLGTALSPEHLGTTVADAGARREALALAAYDAAMLSAIMGEYLKRGTGALGWLKGLTTSASGGKDPAFLAQRARYHREERPGLLRLAAGLGTPVVEAVAAPQP